MISITVTGTNSGDVSLGAVGSTPNSSGASLSGQVLTLQPADATHAGLMSTVAQSFLGKKSFGSGIAHAAVFDSPVDAGTSTPDCNAGDIFFVTATAAVASFTIAAPTNPTAGQIIWLVVGNISGGAITTTWNATFHMATWGEPATGKVASIQFVYTGSAWIELGRSAATVPA